MLQDKYAEKDFSALFNQFFSKPKKMILKALILSQLIQNEAHGYCIMKKIWENTEMTWKPSHSMIYSELAGMEGQGLIAGKKESKGELELKIYQITDKGQKELEYLSIAFLKLFDFSDYTKIKPHPLAKQLFEEAINYISSLPSAEQLKRYEEMLTVIDQIKKSVDTKIRQLKEKRDR